jgi:hypothetical protein
MQLAALTRWLLVNGQITEKYVNITFNYIILHFAVLHIYYKNTHLLKLCNGAFLCFLLWELDSKVYFLL